VAALARILPRAFCRDHVAGGAAAAALYINWRLAILLFVLCVVFTV
jgi:hypothetical protein